MLYFQKVLNVRDNYGLVAVTWITDIIWFNFQRFRLDRLFQTCLWIKLVLFSKICWLFIIFRLYDWFLDWFSHIGIVQGTLAIRFLNVCSDGSYDRLGGRILAQALPKFLNHIWIKTFDWLVEAGYPLPLGVASLKNFSLKASTLRTMYLGLTQVFQESGHPGRCGHMPIKDVILL